MSKRIGIYAGTFDPVHAGHVAFARSAMEICGLNEVIFLPERSPTGKYGVVDIAHRLALLELAVSDEPNMKALDLRVERFTARQVLPELARLLGDSELVLLMGSDVVQSLHAWDHMEELLPAVSLAVGLRRDDTASEIDAVMERLIQLHGPVVYQIVSAPHHRVASTAARSGDHTALHPEVSAYIRHHGLYDANA